MRGLFITLTLLSTLLLSNNSVDIDSYIAQIKKASPQERVKLMNEFKQKVAQMNKEQRLKSIEKMQAKMKASRPQKNYNTMQGQHTNEMNTYQNMNQKQAGKQLKFEENHKDGMKNKDFR